MENIQLLDGIFKESQLKGKEYLLYLDVDRLIAPCYEAIGFAAKKPRYGGWEATQIAGHSIGHWLSAASAMYVATKDKELLANLNYAVDELAYLQGLDPEGYVSGFAKECFDRVFTGNFEVERFNLGGSWVPWYSIHKIYAGLIDVYSLVGNEKALKVVINLADWAKQGTDHLDDAQFQKMLICEYGGMNEVMVDLYNITGNEDYLDLAIRFCHHEVLDPLSIELDELEGMHANTQIPKVIGAAKLYEATGNEKFKRMALFFWNQVTKYRSYIMGGNSNYEHFGPHNQEKLSVQTAETCNTYNMLILTEILYSWEQKAEYMDYYEKALYNHILASQDPYSGMKMYFLSTQPGHFKVYNSPDDSFWCCTGTGMENPARYNRNIYFRENEKIYVNLFIASEWTSDDKKIKLRQVTDFPHSEKVVIKVEKAESQFLNMHIRAPYWVSGPVTMMMNGNKVDVIVNDGYMMIERNWSTGDILEINLPMSLHTYEAKDNPHKVGILYGPIVLAGALGTEDFPESDIQSDHLKLNNHPLIHVPNLIANKDNIEGWITRVDNGSLKFETAHVGQPGNTKLTLIPFYELHHQRYTIYWNMMDEETYQTFVDEEKEQMERLRKITVDFVQPGEQQPEVEHDIASKRSKSGYLNTAERMWRDSLNEGFFSYKMAVNPGQQMYLQVTYFDGDKFIFADGKWYEQDFTILVDDIQIVEQKLEGKRSDRLYNICYEIPFDLTKDKEKVEVKFMTTEGKASGGIFGVRVVNEKSAR